MSAKQLADGTYWTTKGPPSRKAKPKKRTRRGNSSCVSPTLAPAGAATVLAVVGVLDHLLKSEGKHVISIRVAEIDNERCQEDIDLTDLSAAEDRYEEAAFAEKARLALAEGEDHLDPDDDD